MANPRPTILVVEDDRDLRGMYHTALSLAGFDVREAGDGWEALRRMEGSTAPDLILLDLTLPMIGGNDVLLELAGRAQTRQIPVVVVTASPELAVASVNLRCVLRKPVEPDELVETVRRCLEDAGAGGAD